MLEPVVGRTRVDVVAAAKLLDVAHSLELGRVDDFDTQRVELNVSMNTVVEHLPETPYMLGEVTVLTHQEVRTKVIWPNFV